MDNWTASTLNSGFRDSISAVFFDSSTTIKNANRGRAKRFLRFRAVERNSRGSRCLVTVDEQHPYDAVRCIARYQRCGVRCGAGHRLVQNGRQVHPRGAGKPRGTHGPGAAIKHRDAAVLKGNVSANLDVTAV